MYVGVLHYVVEAPQVNLLSKVLVLINQYDVYVVHTYVLLRKSLLLSSCDMSRNDTFAKFSSHFTSRSDFYFFIADLANGCQT